ncbi:hypothetical protein C8R45DRAFT_205049 [Mycena sanguinolenta]|nr:hypothetical protein C8R45DRAFT_205049 [Mycena sanguinolenta]
MIEQSMARSVLPPEIYAVICDEFEGWDGALAVLCITSRNFCDEAQRILYRSVDLRGRSMPAVKSWALAVTHHEHLAERVHALALELPPVLTLNASDTTEVVRALKKCVNLKELRISAEDKSARGHQSWIFRDDYPFRLQKFESVGIPQNAEFWKPQTQIRVLSLLDSLQPSFENQLPDVIALATTSLFDLPARPLQRVETMFQADFSPLAQYSRTLTTLTVRRVGDRVIVIPTSLQAIATSLPALLHLGLIEHTTKVFIPFCGFAHDQPHIYLSVPAHAL